MPLPKNIFSVTAFACETILVEQDMVHSAIRMLDAIYMTRVDDVVEREKQRIQINLLIMVRADTVEETEHSLQITLTRPNGDQKVQPPIPITMKSLIPGLTGGHTIQADLRVVPIQMGTHLITVTIDGEEAAKVRFTLLEVPVAQK